MFPETLLMDITRFAFSDQNERQQALREFEISLRGKPPTEEEMETFEMDYVFSRKHSIHHKTFIRLFVEHFEELYGKEWSKEILSLDENFSGCFEVTDVVKDSVMVTELVIGDTLKIKYPPECHPRKGDILIGRVFKWKKEYYFFGSLSIVHEKEAVKKEKELASRIKFICHHATESFKEYFQDTVVVFKDRYELSEKYNDFMRWFFLNKAPPGVLDHDEDFEHLDFEELGDKKEIGLLIDYYTGQRVIPEYGYAVKIFSGKWEEVDDYQEKIKQVLYQDDIPWYDIKELIETNPEHAVKVYSEVFSVETVQDVLELFAKYRRDSGIIPRRQSMVLEG
ncbi:MAG: hypothetical protein PVF58_07475 [Candidatus Methanofastidiosia archaeon]|jgi:hypothetical protein